MFQYLIFFYLENEKLTLLVIRHGRKSVSKPGSFLSVIFASDICVCSSEIQDKKFFQVNVTKVCIDVQKKA